MIKQNADTVISSEGKPCLLLKLKWIYQDSMHKNWIRHWGKVEYSQSQCPTILLQSLFTSKLRETQFADFEYSYKKEICSSLICLSSSLPIDTACEFKSTRATWYWEEMLNYFHKLFTHVMHEFSFNSHSRQTHLYKSEHIFRKTEDIAPISIVCHCIIETHQNINE